MDTRPPSSETESFTVQKQVLEGKAKQLRVGGRGKQPNKARQLTQQEEELLWKEGKFGIQTPQALINTVWWLLTQFFGLRGRQEHHDMKVDDFQLCKDDDGCEYVAFSEGLTKTRQGGLSKQSRDFEPRMFEIGGGERCPVLIFKEYLSRRPANLRNSGPFYLSIKANRRENDDKWFKVQPMGINKINDMMKNIITGTSLEETAKKFTNHSARKTLVAKMKKAHVERSNIIKVTGHRSIQSLDDYDESNEEEQRQLSFAIAKRNNTPSSNKENACPSEGYRELHAQQQPPRRSENLPISLPSSLVQVPGLTMPMNPTMMKSQEQQSLLNSFNSCTVSFNFYSKASSPNYVESTAPKRRYSIIDSDSD